MPLPLLSGDKTGKNERFRLIGDPVPVRALAFAPFFAPTPAIVRVPAAFSLLASDRRSAFAFARASVVILPSEFVVDDEGQICGYL